MWHCPKCGEQIEDQFDSCWQCTKVAPLAELADDHPKRQRAGLWCAWRRGWLIILMMLVHGLFASLVALFFEHNEGILAVVGLAVIIFILPLSAYWIFVFFFDEKAWPSRNAAHKILPEDQAVALLDEATKLEVRGHVSEALAKYQTVVERFGGTAASHDAQKSIKSLRARIG